MGISGPPGAGKSTLARAIARALGDAALVFMDHYQRMTAMPIDDVARWMERGAKFDQLPVPLLAEHLARLRRGEPVVDPATRETIEPRPTIVLETHFGRAHAASGSHIDFLVWLDVPLDVALSRNVRSFVRSALAKASPDAVRGELAWIEGYLSNYERVVGALLRIQAERVRRAADLVITAGTAPSVALEQSLAAMRAQFLDP